MRTVLCSALLATCAGAALGTPEIVVEVRGLAAPRAAPAPPEERRAAHDEARAVMAERCALCHGPRGRADGLLSSTLKPAPRDLSDAAWQARVSDEHLARAILEGGGAVGRSPVMPAHADLKEKPAVVAELVRLVRGMVRRGVVRAAVVRAAVVSEEKAEPLARAEAPPDESGTRALLRLPCAPGTVNVRGYFDADESGAREASEPGFARDGVVVAGEGVVQLDVMLRPSGGR